MKLVTADEMRSIEEAHLRKTGASLEDLMAEAGAAVARTVYSLCGKSARVLVCSGKGNNGGDGFVAAKLLADQGYPVRVVKTAADEDYTDAAAEALRALRASGVPIEEYAGQGLDSVDLVVDALLGFGLKGALAGALADLTEKINAMEARVVSVDIPTGVNSDDGSVAGTAVRADYTVTFTAPKRGLYLLPGADYAGKVETVDIGISRELVDSGGHVTLIDADFVSPLVPGLPKYAHKKSAGRVLLVAGSAGMTGAATLAAKAAMRAGSGLTVLIAPESLNDIFEVKLTEVLTVAAPETEARTLAVSAVQRILEMEKDFDCLAMGPGLGRHRSTAELVISLLEKSALPVVLDADGLFALASDTTVLRRRAAETVITPHSGELSRLVGKPASEIDSRRLSISEMFSKETSSTMILKGYHPVIAGPAFVGLCDSGNPGMATAGTGDVLTGIVAALLARALPPVEAAALGSYVHGLAGDLSAAEKGILATTAGDLLDYLPSAWKALSAS